MGTDEEMKKGVCAWQDDSIWQELDKIFGVIEISGGHDVREGEA